MTEHISARLKPPLIIMALPWLFLFYTLSSNRVVSGNDGSHFALVKAMVFEGTFRINNQMQMTKFDNARVGDNFFTDRPPGSAFLALPFVAAGVILNQYFPSLEVNYPPGSYAVILPALCGALAALLLFLSLRSLGCREESATVAALIFCLCTMQWKYSTALFSHGVAAAFVLLAVYLILRIRRDISPPSATLMLVSGIVIGYLPGLEYMAALLIAPFTLYVIAALWIRARRGEGSPSPARHFSIRLALFAAGGVIGALPLLYYNWKCFGHPFDNSYRYQTTFHWSKDMAQTFDGAWRVGFAGLMWNRATRGLFYMSPVMLLALAGFALGLRRRGARIEMAGALMIFAAYVAWLSKHRTFYGGATSDHRYIVFIVPMLALGLGFFIDALLRPSRGGPPEAWGRWLRFQGWGLLALLAALSLFNMGRDMTTFLGHDYLLRPSAEFSTSLQLIENRLFAIFPGTKQFRLYFFTTVILSAIGAAGVWLSRPNQRGPMAMK